MPSMQKKLPNYMALVLFQDSLYTIGPKNPWQVILDEKKLNPIIAIRFDNEKNATI